MVKTISTKERETNSNSFANSRTYSNLQECFEHLSMEESRIPTSVAIAEIHQLCKSKSKLISKIRKRASEILKICRSCDKWDKAYSIITCENCDDHYHKKCYQDSIKAKINLPFICNLCVNDGEPVKKCQCCDENIKKRDNVDTCQSCHYEYHTKCFNKKMKMCNRCAKLAELMPTKQNKNGKESSFAQLKINEMFAMIATKNHNKANRLEHLVESKGQQFLAMKLITKKDSKLIQKYKKQLLEVIAAKNMNYTEYLVDLDIQLQNLSSQSLDFGLANMSKAEQKEYLQYKSQPIGPFRFKTSVEKGVDVIADMDIPEYSIICEYIGEVLTLRKCIDLERVHKNDSVMDLWVGKNSEKKLVICPYKWTNIARFLNGVGKRKEQKNVHSIKICFRGKPMVLLVSSRKIKKGQSLCYDYNGDNQGKYPTDYFV